VSSSCALDADAIDQLSRGDSKIKELLHSAPAPVSMFIGPNDEQLADAVIGGEGMVVAEIDTPNRPLWIRNLRCRDEQPPDESSQRPQDESISSVMAKVREETPGRSGGRSAQLSIRLLGDNDSAEFFIGSNHSRRRYALDTASSTLLHSYFSRFQPFHDNACTDESLYEGASRRPYSQGGGWRR